MATKGSSRKWLREHFADPYVQQAHQAGYRSRAIFKLQEIQERDRIFKPGMTVVDLGAAPGGWSQYVVKLVKPKGRIIAIDLLPMEPIDGVEILQGDFGEDDVLEALKHQITQDPAGQVKGTVDFVLSDVAPNMSGHKGVDIPKSMYFAELALDFALQVLQPKGGFLIKVFQGEGSEVFLAEIKRNFKSVVIRKPKASRGRSREIYVLARELKKL